MEGSNNNSKKKEEEETNMEISALPSLLSSHPERGSSNNDAHPNSPLPPSSDEINGELNKGKGLAPAQETTPEPKSEAQVVDLHAVEPVDLEMEAKRQKRIMASRAYSRKYRIKQLEYIVQLETELKTLQSVIAINSPRIKYADRHNMLLRAENHAIRQKLAAFTAELMFKQAQQDALTKERNSLLQLYRAMQQKSAVEGLGAFNRPDYQWAGLNRPRLELGIADRFTRPTGPGMMLNQFGAGQSFVGNDDESEMQNNPAAGSSYKFM